MACLEAPGCWSQRLGAVGGLSDRSQHLWPSFPCWTSHLARRCSSTHLRWRWSDCATQTAGICPFSFRLSCWRLSCVKTGMFLNSSCCVASLLFFWATIRGDVTRGVAMSHLRPFFWLNAAFCFFLWYAPKASCCATTLPFSFLSATASRFSRYFWLVFVAGWNRQMIAGPLRQSESLRAHIATSRFLTKCFRSACYRNIPVAIFLGWKKRVHIPWRPLRSAAKFWWTLARFFFRCCTTSRCRAFKVKMFSTYVFLLSSAVQRRHPGAAGIQNWDWNLSLQNNLSRLQACAMKQLVNIMKKFPAGSLNSNKQFAQPLQTRRRFHVVMTQCRVSRLWPSSPLTRMSSFESWFDFFGLENTSKSQPPLFFFHIFSWMSIRCFHNPTSCLRCCGISFGRCWGGILWLPAIFCW